MTTVLFIHGTGSRDPKAYATFTRIRDGILAERPGLGIERCYWGPYGAPGRQQYLSATFTEDSDSGDAGEGDIPLWAQLMADPLFEIRLRQVQGAPPASVGQFGEKLRDQISKLGSDDRVRTALEAEGLRPVELAAAMAEVAGSVEFYEVYGSAVYADDDAKGVLSRALVASCLRAASERGHELTGSARDELVKVVGSSAFGGAPQAGLGDRFGAIAMSIARRAAPVALPAAAHTMRPAWMRPAQAWLIENAADILVYQARGEHIRGFVREAICAIDDEVVLLAHSLGGVIAFDLLAGPRPGAGPPTGGDPLTKIRMLVTVGSQVPLFYEIGALASGFSAQTGPPNFTVPWLNVYDARDLLAYAGRGLFGTRVVDKRIDTGMPFPNAHWAYWAEKGLFEWLVDRMGEKGLC